MIKRLWLWLIDRELDVAIQQAAHYGEIAKGAQDKAERLAWKRRVLLSGGTPSRRPRESV